MYAVIGLGNPGRDYEDTRHNIGFNTVDLLAYRNNIEINKIKFKSVYGKGRIGNESVLIVKPQTYMNNSGISVLDLCQYYKIPIENILVVADDIDIGFGTLRVKRKGSAGTHNGLKSVIYHLKSEDFPRIKIGIGSPPLEWDLADFVLSKFQKEEEEIIKKAVEVACEAIEATIKEDIDIAMNQFN